MQLGPRDGRSNIDPTSFSIEKYLAVHQRKEGEVLTLPHVTPPVESISHLTHEDITRDDLLTAELLDTQTLGIRIPAVPAGPLAFFMSHDNAPDYLAQFFYGHDPEL